MKGGRQRPPLFSPSKTSVANANSGRSRRRVASLRRDRRLKRSFEIKKIELADRWRHASAAGRPPRRKEAAQGAEFPRRVGGQEDPSDLEKPHTFRTCANVSLKRRHQAGNQTRPQRDMIFAQRIAQLDRFPRQNPNLTSAGRPGPRCALRQNRARPGVAAIAFQSHSGDPRSKRA